MNAVSIPLDLVVAADHARPVAGAAVDILAHSMAQIGLLQPVIVVKARVNRGAMTDGYRIVAGGHRLAAARTLGWETIPAFVLDSDTGNLEAELIEIDENLCRAELTPAQRAAAIARRKQIWEALHPESGRNPPTLGGRGNVSFAADTAAASGESKRRINEHLSRAVALGADLQAVAGTSLDKGVELDALKAIPAPERKELISRARAGEKVSARKPAARLSLTIEYFNVHDGACSIARAIIVRDRALALALLDELDTQLQEAA
jgi:hypothetical protein